MAKGDYKKEFGGSRSGYEKGKKDAKNENILWTTIAVVGTFILGVFVGNSKK